MGLRRDEFALNTLYSCLFNAMGIYPLIFLALIQPSGQSGNKVGTFSTFTGRITFLPVCNSRNFMPATARLDAFHLKLKFCRSEMQDQLQARFRYLVLNQACLQGPCAYETGMEITRRSSSGQLRCIRTSTYLTASGSVPPDCVEGWDATLYTVPWCVANRAEA